MEGTKTWKKSQVSDKCSLWWDGGEHIRWHCLIQCKRQFCSKEGNTYFLPCLLLCLCTEYFVYFSAILYICFFFTGWTLPVNSIFTFLPVSYENISTCTVWLCLFICFHLFILPAHPSPQQWVKNYRFCQLKLIDAGLKIQIPERFCSKRSPDRLEKPC